MTGFTGRRNAGSGHSYFVDGEKSMGVTTIIREGVPAPALMGWAGRTVAEYCFDRRADLEGLDRDEYVALAKGAPNRARNRKGARGTSVHGLAHRLALGETVEVPDDLEGHLDAYLAWAADWDVHDLWTEAVVISRQPRYGGTLDVICEATWPGGDRCRWLVDLKTSSGVYPDTCLQLAGYRHADEILGTDGRWQPMPQVDRCGILHLTADGYTFHEALAGEREYAAFMAALGVARWRAHDGESLGATYNPQPLDWRLADGSTPTTEGAPA